VRVLVGLVLHFFIGDVVVILLLGLHLVVHSALLLLLGSARCVVLLGVVTPALGLPVAGQLNL